MWCSFRSAARGLCTKSCVGPSEERLDNESYDRHFGPFERGDVHFLSNEDWRAIRDGTYEYPDLPSDDLAVPPK